MKAVGRKTYDKAKCQQKAFLKGLTSMVVTEWGAGSGAGLAVDGSGSVFVVDFRNNRVQKFDNTGAMLTAWGCGPGTGEGQFDDSQGVAVDRSGHVFVVDSGNNRIQKFACP